MILLSCPVQHVLLSLTVFNTLGGNSSILLCGQFSRVASMLVLPSVHLTKISPTRYLVMCPVKT